VAASIELEAEAARLATSAFKRAMLPKRKVAASRQHFAVNRVMLPAFFSVEAAPVAQAARASSAFRTILCACAIEKAREKAKKSHAEKVCVSRCVRVQSEGWTETFRACWSRTSAGPGCR
jgi:hypothetical protein